MFGIEMWWIWAILHIICFVYNQLRYRALVQSIAPVECPAEQDKQDAAVVAAVEIIAGSVLALFIALPAFSAVFWPAEGGFGFAVMIIFMAVVYAADSWLMVRVYGKVDTTTVNTVYQLAILVVSAYIMYDEWRLLRWPEAASVALVLGAVAVALFRSSHSSSMKRRASIAAFFYGVSLLLEAQLAQEINIAFFAMILSWLPAAGIMAYHRISPRVLWKTFDSKATRWLLLESAISGAGAYLFQVLALVEGERTGEMFGASIAIAFALVVNAVVEWLVDRSTNSFSRRFIAAGLVFSALLLRFWTG